MSRRQLTLIATSAATLGALVAPSAAYAETTYTLQQVRQHSTSSDCWSAINGSVYNLTAFIPRHEGGPKRIISLCGIDGTAIFTSAHGNGRGGESDEGGDVSRVLARYRIGAYDASSANPKTPYTLADVAKHGTKSDCWSAINGGVYDLTSFIGTHIGGPAPIEGLCGIDGTASYVGKHGTSSIPASALASLKIGVLTGSGKPGALPTYTLADVAKHGSKTDCWSAVSGGVYDLTAWIPKHPGGPAVIESMCGSDGTTLFNSKHEGSASATGTLANFKIGTLGATTSAPKKAKTYTMAQVRKHNKASNCWTVVGKNVYNITGWAPRHPGGRQVIISMCGKNGTTLFNGVHSGSASAKAQLKSFKIGKLR